jgi:hypothetical protein
MEGLIEGRIVHYVLPDGPTKGEHRPAIVVKVWRGELAVNSETKQEENMKDTAVQLQVFMDGDGRGWNDHAPNIIWRTSVIYSDEKRPGTWHWIEKA